MTSRPGKRNLIISILVKPQTSLILPLIMKFKEFYLPFPWIAGTFSKHLEVSHTAAIVA